MRRLAAGAVAGGLAFVLTYLLLGGLLTGGVATIFFASFALAIAAAIAAVTMKRGLAVAFGVLGAIWLLFELLFLVIASIAGAIG